MTVVEIFTLTVEPHGTYRYTSANQDIQHGGHTYAKIAITRQQAESKSDISQPGQIRVELPLSDPFAQLFVGYPPESDATATIHRGTLDFDDGLIDVEPVVVDGLVSSTGSEDGLASFEVHPITATLDVKGPRKLYSGACQWRLYGPGCKLDRATFLVSVAEFFGTTSPDDREVEITLNVNHPAGYFVGGIYQPDGVDPIMIVKQPAPVDAGGGAFVYTLTLARWADGITDVPIEITPGCSYSRATCVSRFDNLDNFGGFPTLENVDRSPFLNGWSQ